MADTKPLSTGQWLHVMQQETDTDTQLAFAQWLQEQDINDKCRFSDMILWAVQDASYSHFMFDALCANTTTEQAHKIRTHVHQHLCKALSSGGALNGSQEHGLVWLVQQNFSFHVVPVYRGEHYSEALGHLLSHSQKPCFLEIMQHTWKTGTKALDLDVLADTHLVLLSKKINILPDLSHTLPVLVGALDTHIHHQNELISSFALTGISQEGRALINPAIVGSLPHLPHTVARMAEQQHHLCTLLMDLPGTVAGTAAEMCLRGICLVLDHCPCVPVFDDTMDLLQAMCAEGRISVHALSPNTQARLQARLLQHSISSCTLEAKTHPPKRM